MTAENEGRVTMKKPISARLDDGVLQLLDAFAESHGITRTEALEKAIRGLQEPSEGRKEQSTGEQSQRTVEAVIEALKASNADLRSALVDARSTISTLTAQLAVKDDQIATAHGLVDQSHRLHMAEVQRSLPPARMTMREKIRRFMRNG